MTSTPREASAWDSLAACERPAARPLPRNVSSVSAPTDVTLPVVVTGEAAGDAEISVPGAEGLSVFLIAIGIDFAIAGPIVAGWSTFAPACANSSASSYVIQGSAIGD